MSDLTEFLTARLDETAILAAKMPAESWRALGSRLVLAGTRIVTRHRNCGTGVGYCDDGGHGVELRRDAFGCADLFDLAAIWIGHPDYDQDWAP